MLLQPPAVQSRRADCRLTLLSWKLVVHQWRQCAVVTMSPVSQSFVLQAAARVEMRGSMYDNARYKSQHFFISATLTSPSMPVDLRLPVMQTPNWKGLAYSCPSYCTRPFGTIYYQTAVRRSPSCDLLSVRLESRYRSHNTRVRMHCAVLHVTAPTPIHRLAATCSVPFKSLRA